MLNKLTSNTDKATTVLGAILSAILVSKIDFTKLLSGDHTEIGNAVAAVVVGLLGWFTNKSKPTA